MIAKKILPTRQKELMSNIVNPYIIVNNYMAN